MAHFHSSGSMFKFSLTIISLLTCTSSFAGTGLYYDIGVASQQLFNSTQITTTLTSPPGENTASDESDIAYTNYSLAIGYKAKRRLTDRFYLAPQLQLSQLDGKALYATSLLAGSDIGHFSWNITAGIGRIDKFNTNTLLAGAGIEWFITQKITAHISWQRFQTIREQTLETGNFGAQTITTATDTRRELSQVILGVRFYLGN